MEIEAMEVGDWPVVKFGDFVRKVKMKFDPIQSDVELFVAGRHIDGGDLTVRRWGYLREEYVGPAFDTIFTPGQVLYVSRRTYLRKVAIAKFRGVCSNTTFVLETSKPDSLLPEYLPVLMSTESFHNYSEFNSKGSVTPYVNFSDIAKFEFRLPPISVQQRMINLFSACHKTRDAYKDVLDSSIRLFTKLGDHIINNFPLTKSVTDYCEINNRNISNSQLKLDEMWDYIDLGSVNYPLLRDESTKISLSSAPSRARRIVAEGDLLISTVRPNLRGHIIIDSCPSNTIASTGFSTLTPNDKKMRSLLLSIFYSNDFYRYAVSRSKGTNYPAITASDISNYKLPDLDLDDFKLLFPLADNLRYAIDKLQNRIIPAISNLAAEISRIEYEL